TRRRHLEAAEFERRRHDAADQRPVAQALRRLPGASRDDRLRPLAGRDVRAEPVTFLALTIRGQSQSERGAGMVSPHLDSRGDAVPARLLAGAQQIVDRSSVTAAALRRTVAIGLDELAALGMRLQAEARANRGRLAAQVMSFATVAAIDGRLANSSYQRA